MKVQIIYEGNKQNLQVSGNASDLQDLQDPSVRLKAVRTSRVGAMRWSCLQVVQLL